MWGTHPNLKIERRNMKKLKGERERERLITKKKNVKKKKRRGWGQSCLDLNSLPRSKTEEHEKRKEEDKGKINR